MLIFGVLAMAASGAAGGYLCWSNRHSVAQIHIGDHVWTVHLYGVFIIGGLLACWFLLGASCLHLRLRERREGLTQSRGKAGSAQTAPSRAAIQPTTGKCSASARTATGRHRPFNTESPPELADEGSR